MFSKRIKPEFENANLNDAINETITLAQHHLELNEIEIVKRMKPVRPFRFDIGQLQQVFLNLITNATHAMTRGGKLLIETFIEDKSAIVKFTDNGAISDTSSRKYGFHFSRLKIKIKMKKDR